MAAHALDVSREAVRVLALEHGLEFAADHYKLSLNTVKAWSARFNWFPCKASSKPIATIATGPSADTLQAIGERSKLRLAIAGEKASEHFAGQSGKAVVEQSSDYKNIVTAAAQLHGWDQRFAGQAFTLNVLNIGACGIEIADKSKTSDG